VQEKFSKKAQQENQAELDQVRKLLYQQVQ
jgi:hypothetical protein